MELKSDLRIGKTGPYPLRGTEKNLGGITNTMLSSTLKDLEDKGIVIREQYNEIPPHVEYSLSDSGRAMLSIYYEIAKWGSQYLP